MLIRFVELISNVFVVFLQPFLVCHPNPMWTTTYCTIKIIKGNLPDQLESSTKGFVPGARVEKDINTTPSVCSVWCVVCVCLGEEVLWSTQLGASSQWPLSFQLCGEESSVCVRGKHNTQRTEEHCARPSFLSLSVSAPGPHSEHSGDMLLLT